MPDWKYFEDFEVGEEHTTSGRTMTDADIRLFIGCTDNTHPVHVDSEYCAKFPAIGRPILQGVLTLSVADGFMAKEISPTRVPTAHYGHEKVRYIKPVYPGDNIHCVFKLTDKNIKDEKFGVTTWDVTIYNQKGDAVLFYVDKQYVGRKPAAKE